MQVRTAIMIQALRQWQARLEAVTERQLRDPYFHERMEDLVVGCFDLLEYSPTFDMAAWLKRRPRRLALAEPSTAARTSAGRMAIQELVALTISDLEASAGFRPHVESGVLSMKAPRRISAAHHQALTDGHRRYRAALTHSRIPRPISMVKKVSHAATIA
jgi:hypothetical protein